MLEAHQRDILLEAIARSAEELLRTSDMTRSIPKMLEDIGHAANLDRVHLLSVDPAGAIDVGRIIGHNWWSAAGISTPAIFHDARDRTMVEVGLVSWLPRLMAGEIITGHARNFEEAVRTFFEFGGIKSTLGSRVCRRPMVGLHRLRCLPQRTRMVAGRDRYAQDAGGTGWRCGYPHARRARAL